MRLVFVTAYPPTPERSRAYVFATELAKRHEVTVVCLCRTPRDILAVGRLRAPGVQVTPVFEESGAASLRTARALLGDQPLDVAYDDAPRLREAVWAEIERGDVGAVHVEHLRAASAARDLPVATIWDAVACNTRRLRLQAKHAGNRLRRAALDLARERTEPYERHLLRLFRYVVVGTEAELKHVRAVRDAGASFAPAVTDDSPTVHVLPTAVDLDRYQPESFRRQPARLVYSAVTGDGADTLAVELLLREIMPRVWRIRRDATLTLAGVPLPRRLHALARDPRITVASGVDDVRPYLGGAAIALAPLPYAVGTPVAALEAMAMGTPLVASDAVAGSLRAIPGADLLVGAGPDRFAHLVLRLLQDDALRQALARNGRAYVERQHAAGAVTAQLEALYTIASGHNFAAARGALASTPAFAAAATF